jgi:hypothetical protein
VGQLAACGGLLIRLDYFTSIEYGISSMMPP